MLQNLTESLAQLGIALNDRQGERFERYQAMLIEEGARLNLTAETMPEGIQRRHFVESAALLAALRSEGAFEDAIDVGSGAGVPGIPLAILEPGLRVTLLDATAKKTEFLVRVVRELELHGVEVVTGRAEALAHDASMRERFDLAISKALAPLPMLLELTLPFVRLGGVLAAPKGSRVDEEIAASGRALVELGGEPAVVRPLAVPSEQGQAIVLVRKAKPAPSRYPRRWAAISKRPL